ncbi:MAG: hypothetical protein Q9180_005380 [Flavoplaca navasiana]
MVDELNESLEKEQRYRVAAETLTETTAETHKGVKSTYHLLEDLGARDITEDEDLLVLHSLERPAAERTREIYEVFRPNLIDGTGSWLREEPLSALWTEQKQTWANLYAAFYSSLANADSSMLLVLDGLDEAPREVSRHVIGRITVKGYMEFEREDRFIVVPYEKDQEDLDRHVEVRSSTISIIKRRIELDKAEAKKPSKSRQSLKYQSQEES